MSKENAEVLMDPRGVAAPPFKPIEPAPRLDTLKDKTLLLVESPSKYFNDVLEEAFKKKYKVTKVIRRTRGRDPKEVVMEVGELGVDAIVMAEHSRSGTWTPLGGMFIFSFEKDLRLPTVSIIIAWYIPLFLTTFKIILPYVAVVPYYGRADLDKPEVVKEKAEKLMPDIVDGLTLPMEEFKKRFDMKVLLTKYTGVG